MISGKILKILNHLYEKVETLEQFIGNFSVIEAEKLVLEDDTQNYVGMLKSTLVGTPYGSRSAPTNILVKQISRQNEIVLRVVERIRNREGKGSNLLTLGYNPMSDNVSAQISTSRNIENNLPNQNTSRLQYGPWKTLLERIGDDIMEFLLENKSIFITVTPNCYIQLSGMPLCAMSTSKKIYFKTIKSRVKNVYTSLLNYRKKMSKKNAIHKTKSLCNLNRMENRLIDCTTLQVMMASDLDSSLATSSATNSIKPVVVQQRLQTEETNSIKIKRLLPQIVCEHETGDPPAKKICLDVCAFLSDIEGSNSDETMHKSCEPVCDISTLNCAKENPDNSFTRTDDKKMQSFLVIEQGTVKPKFCKKNVANTFCIQKDDVNMELEYNQERNEQEPVDVTLENIEIHSLNDMKSLHVPKKEKSTDCDSALIPLLCVHG